MQVTSVNNRSQINLDNGKCQPISGRDSVRMPYNGTAIGVVCVTWRNPPVDCPGSGVGKSPGGPPGMARYLRRRVRLF